MKPITHYRLMWDVTAGRGSIALLFSQGASDEVLLNDLDPAAYRVIVDILRNERPVYWDAAAQRLATGAERVGEEEID